jgi:hypothetical protein
MLREIAGRCNDWDTHINDAAAAVRILERSGYCPHLAHSGRDEYNTSDTQANATSADFCCSEHFDSTSLHATSPRLH